jgi:isopenicillin N synthase-like dioxygenase
MGASAIYGPNQWPAHLPELREAVLGYWRLCDGIVDRLLSVFEHALGLAPATMRSLFDAPVTNMTLLHYPPSAPEQPGIHPHKDTNVLTLLHPDPVGGLQVRTRSGEWIDARCPSDALLVNTGDMMEVWSGGRFLSTPHRVTNASGQERYSFPYFSVPRHDVVIEPMVTPVPGYNSRPPITVGPWSLEVWRTNWPDATPEDDTSHLGTIDF